MKFTCRCFGVMLALAPGLSVLCSAAEPAQPEGITYSPNVARQRTQVYWGDLHLHTSLSADAYTLGTRVTQDMAYRFARGQTIRVDNGMEVRPRYALDFLAISDHAEYLSVYQRLDEEDPVLDDWAVGREWRKLLRAGQMGELTMAFANAFQNPTPENLAPPAVVASAWRDVVATADRYNEPHLFTAFPAYEWTSTISGDNLHRVVIYREGAPLADSVTPFSSQDSNDPEALWQALADYEGRSGGEVLAIPHNSNVSNGRMFAPETHAGKPFDADYAERRQRWEPLLEVTQVKGDSETHPILSPDDRYADFERWDEGNIQLSKAKEQWMYPFEYARSALSLGLEHQRRLGVNPFRFGMVGSTDSHTGVSATAEDNFFGKFPTSEPSAERMFTRMAKVLNDNWRLTASGLTAIWAQENTREALFDALRRREVYATTGSRITLRFFGGWDYSPSDLNAISVSDIGYARGVPMGAALPPGDEATSPSFLLLAMKEPDGPDLEALQIVKGWLDADGKAREAVIDVAFAEHGASLLEGVWRDPDFDPQRHAFYYARVVEVPRPRWTAVDAEFFGVEAPPAAPATVQDRAYSSPIWHVPR